MSVMDKIKDMLKSHPEQTGKAVDKGGDQVGKKTRGTHREQVDTARRKAKDKLGGQDESPGQQ